ncbi:hypothetical protein R6Q57_003575, partial [Mikania cordata]
MLHPLSFNRSASLPPSLSLRLLKPCNLQGQISKFHSKLSDFNPNLYQMFFNPQFYFLIWIKDFGLITVDFVSVTGLDLLDLYDLSLSCDSKLWVFLINIIRLVVELIEIGFSSFMTVCHILQIVGFDLFDL